MKLDKVRGVGCVCLLLRVEFAFAFTYVSPEAVLGVFSILLSCWVWFQ